MARIDVTRQNEAEYGVPGDDAGREQFYAKLSGTGQAVSNKPGWSWTHTGSGWAVTDEQAAPGSPGAPAPASPGPGEPPTTAPGVPQRPSPAPDQSPLPPSPAPQIPLGSPNQPSGSPTPGRVTGPGLLDASQPAGTPGQGDPLQAQVRTALMGMLAQNPNEASITDPDLAPQARAQRAAIERAALQTRAGLMEQASAQGIADSGGVRARGDAITQQAGRDLGAADAALIGEKLASRREQIAQAVQVASALGMQEEANDLQRQLANLDAQLQTRGQDISREGLQLSRDLANLESRDKQYLADLDADLRRQGYGLQERLAMMDAELRRLGINTQGNLGELEIALRRELGFGQLNLGLLQTMLQNSQFNDRLGFDIGQYQSLLNSEVMKYLGSGGR